MLIYLDTLCREIGVPYALVYGNVLGAVRHGGFVPWDDDVDVMIDKKDYKRLCDYLRDNPHPQYKLQSVETDPKCLRLWNTLRDTKSRYIHNKDLLFDNSFKYQGLQIDLFCFDTSIIPSLHYWSFIIYHNTVPKIACKSFWGAKVVYWCLVNILFPTFTLISKLFGDKTNYMRTYGNGPNVAYNVEIMKPFKEIEFEGYTFYGPAKPEKYLEAEFKNWRDLPQKDKRRVHDVSYEFID